LLLSIETIAFLACVNQLRLPKPVTSRTFDLARGRRKRSESFILCAFVAMDPTGRSICRAISSNEKFPAMERNFSISASLQYFRARGITSRIPHRKAGKKRKVPNHLVCPIWQISYEFRRSFEIPKLGFDPR